MEHSGVCLVVAIMVLFVNSGYCLALQELSMSDETDVMFVLDTSYSMN